MIGGLAQGCSNLGALYANGKGVKQDYSKAKTYYGQACDGGITKCCLIVGLLYEEGKGIKQDYSKAKIFYGKACNGGDADGCKYYADLKKKVYYKIKRMYAYYDNLNMGKCVQDWPSDKLRILSGENSWGDILPFKGDIGELVAEMTHCKKGKIYLIKLIKKNIYVLVNVDAVDQIYIKNRY